MHVYTVRCTTATTKGASNHKPQQTEQQSNHTPSSPPTTGNLQQCGAGREGRAKGGASYAEAETWKEWKVVSGGRGKKNIDKAVTQNMHEKSKKGKTKG
jgi:hypothetical protein